MVRQVVLGGQPIGTQVVRTIVVLVLFPCYGQCFINTCNYLNYAGIIRPTTGPSLIAHATYDVLTHSWIKPFSENLNGAEQRILQLTPKPYMVQNTLP